MHPLLRVYGRLAVTGLCRVVGFGRDRRDAAEVVHQPAGVVPIDPVGGDHLQIAEPVQRADPEWRVTPNAFVLVEADRGLGEGMSNASPTVPIEGRKPSRNGVSPKRTDVY